MRRNSQNHFALAPQVSITRSRFKRPTTHKTTFAAGRLIPIYCEEIYPGDTVKMNYSFSCRMATPVFPVMDNCYLDIFMFFIPDRLTWDHWEEFNGYNDDPWTQQTEYEVPNTTLGTVGSDDTPLYVYPYSLADYFGLPTYVPNLSYNLLPFRSYFKVWNDWFRDENLQTTCYLNLSDQSDVYSPSTFPIISGYIAPEFQFSNSHNELHLCAPVAKFADYFTTALPEPQKGNPVSLPLGLTAELTTGDYYDVGSPIRLGVPTGSSGGSANYLGLGTNIINDSSKPLGDLNFVGSGTGESSDQEVTNTNLYANLADATAATINDLRMAFQLQKLYERDARGGTRYTEILKSHFGVTSPDARLQRSEYLGGERFIINMQQVLQTSSTDNTSPQGNTAAFSHTTGKQSCFTKSFVEHGYLLGVCCVRTDNTYQQGLNRMWSRRKRFDFYWPVFANLGEQAVLNKEIYAQGTDVDDEVFGYQEAWAELRYSPAKVTGGFRSNLVDHGGSLDSWHYAQYYDELPVLSDAWIREGSEGIQRTLAQGSLNENEQFIADFYFDTTWVRPMPMYSVPGLIDHH